MKRISFLTTLCSLALAASVQAQSVTFDFEDGTDQGFGTGFGNDASASFSIVNIGGSLRMEVPLGGFQVAGRESQGADAFLAAMNAATASPSGYQISYDWYVDTSISGNNGSYLQMGTYINSGAGSYAQDFPGSGKDVEVDGTQLASGGVFSGTVAETLTAKYGALDPGFLAQGFQRFGLIMNGDGSPAVYFDNISITPVPEPSTFALLGLGGALLAIRRRCR